VIGMFGWIRKLKIEKKAVTDVHADRPVKFIRERENVWRVVYADHKTNN